MLEDSWDWFGVTKAEKKVKALCSYSGDRVCDLVASLPEPEMEEDAFDKTKCALLARDKHRCLSGKVS